MAEASNHPLLKKSKKGVNMKLIFGIIITLVISMVAQGRPISEETWRCGDNIVSRGNSKQIVLSQCGDPDTIDIKEEEFFIKPSESSIEKIQGKQQEGKIVLKKITNVTETWKYNEGANGFIKILTFENAWLTSIVSSARGSGPQRPFLDKTSPKIDMMNFIETLKKIAAKEKLVIRSNHADTAKTGYRLENIELIGDVIQISIGGME